ncbi:MAG: hypothetical protein K2J84_04030 [Bacteroidaceae bacterium]|nr:hypothetical protein [Bacteroidaceae bacterium]
MKKIFLMVSAIMLSICVYANTCTYDGVQVSLQSEKVQCITGVAIIKISVNDTSKKEVRCQVEVANQRAWITVQLNSGSGTFNIAKAISLPNGTHTIKLIQEGGMCY